MRTTLDHDYELVAKAEALTALIERESARRLVRLGGSEPDAVQAPRRHSESDRGLSGIQLVCGRPCAGRHQEGRKPLQKGGDGSARKNSGTFAMASELEELKGLLWQQWDPIGVNDDSDAFGEYDSYADQIRAMLANEASAEDIARHLDWVAIALMGLPGANRQRSIRVATKAVAIHLDRMRM